MRSLRQVLLVKTFPLVFLVLSCSNDLEVLSINREKVLSLNTSLSQSQFITNDCQLIEGQWELRLVPQTPDYALYKSFTLTARGPAGSPFDEFIFSLVFNVADVNNMVRPYSYNSLLPELGDTVNQVTLLLRQGTEWRSYNLCNNDQVVNYFNLQIERQSVSERILKGSFIGELCFDDLVISVSGQFKDVPY